MIVKSYEAERKNSILAKYNIFLLYGENYGLKKEIKELITTLTTKQNNDTEILSFYENEITVNIENFYNSIYSGSLFGNKKIIIINYGTDKIINEIKDVIENSPKDLVLIILATSLEKKSKLRNFFEKNVKSACIACYPDNEKSLEFIALKELRKKQISLSRESLSLLIEKSNNDRDNLQSEIEKIKSFSLNRKDLDINEIKSIINFSGDYKPEILINECLCGNISQYKKVLSELYMNTINQVYLLRIFSNKIRRLMMMKEEEKNYSNLDNLISSAKPPIFWQEKEIVKKQLSIWNLRELQKIIYKINDTELWCKKNPQISKIVFYNFFSEVCKKANNFS